MILCTKYSTEELYLPKQADHHPVSHHYYHPYCNPVSSLQSSSSNIMSSPTANINERSAFFEKNLLSTRGILGYPGLPSIACLPGRLQEHIRPIIKCNHGDRADHLLMYGSTQSTNMDRDADLVMYEFCFSLHKSIHIPVSETLAINWVSRNGTPFPGQLYQARMLILGALNNS